MKIHRRKSSLRLREYDYSRDGWCAVTICTKGKQPFLGEIVEEKMVLSGVGKIAQKYWQEIPSHFENVTLDEFIVMENHIHGIVVIEHEQYGRRGAINMDVGARHASPLRPKKTSLSTIIGSFKSAVSKKAHKVNRDFAWQRSFYDHIIRNEKELDQIRRYIHFNVDKHLADQDLLDLFIGTT